MVSDSIYQANGNWSGWILNIFDSCTITFPNGQTEEEVRTCCDNNTCYEEAVGNCCHYEFNPNTSNWQTCSNGNLLGNVIDMAFPSPMCEEFLANMPPAPQGESNFQACNADGVTGSECTSCNMNIPLEMFPSWGGVVCPGENGGVREIMTPSELGMQPPVVSASQMCFVQDAPDAFRNWLTSTHSQWGDLYDEAIRICSEAPEQDSGYLCVLEDIQNQFNNLDTAVGTQPSTGLGQGGNGFCGSCFCHTVFLQLSFYWV